MAEWAEVETAAGELASAARERFDAHRHKVLATLRRDGSPRISGVEATFLDGVLYLGMMPDSAKAADLLRDPRMALHSTSPEPDEADPSAWAGDAKLEGGAIEVTDEEERARFAGAQEGMPPGTFDLFRIDVTSLTTVRVGDPADHLVIETWREGKGLRRIERR